MADDTKSRTRPRREDPIGTSSGEHDEGAPA
jgi:hypothetical protein